MMAHEYMFNVYMTNGHSLAESKLSILEKTGSIFFDYTDNVPLKGIDLLIDTSGDPATRFKFIRMINNNGVAILFGTNGKAPETKINGEDIDYIIERKISMVGSVDGAKKHYFDALRYLEKWSHSQNSVINKLLTGTYSPENTEIFLNKPEAEIKSIIKWQ
jgi:glucose/galactose 1-dehydrogenase (NADP+)